MRPRCSISGDVFTSSLAFLNPLRYRGYVYDDETGLYYLQSRYYGDKTYNLDICNEPSLPEEKGDGEMWIYFWENPEVMVWNKVYVICGEYVIDPSGDSFTLTQGLNDYVINMINDIVGFSYPKGSSITFHRIKSLKKSFILFFLPYVVSFK